MREEIYVRVCVYVCVDVQKYMNLFRWWYKEIVIIFVV